MKLTPTLLAIAVFAGSAFLAHAISAQGSASDLASLKRELPLIEAAGRGPGTSLVVLVSGDGGWATIEKDMASEFNEHGVAVVGFDLREYLRKKSRTPDDVGRDVGRVIRAYSDSWGKQGVVLVGFSRGAGMIPFILNRLPADLDARLKLTAFVGLPRSVNMTFPLD
jgi:Type IV secretory pathway, VirJ component